MTKLALPQGVGYWWSEHEPMLPHPRHLVEPGWRQQERDSILAYLRAGHAYELFLGTSWCRFECGIPMEKMGSMDLTDGEWVWPEGLAHYVECHSVRLPEQFVETMRRTGWNVPPLARSAPTEVPISGSGINGAFGTLDGVDILEVDFSEPSEPSEPWMELTYWLAWCREECLATEP